jgi:hypothetical protein
VLAGSTASLCAAALFAAVSAVCAATRAASAGALGLLHLRLAVESRMLLVAIEPSVAASRAWLRCGLCELGSSTPIACGEKTRLRSTSSASACARIP